MITEPLRLGGLDVLFHNWTGPDLWPNSRLQHRTDFVSFFFILFFKSTTIEGPRILRVFDKPFNVPTSHFPPLQSHHSSTRRRDPPRPRASAPPELSTSAKQPQCHTSTTDAGGMSLSQPPTSRKLGFGFLRLNYYLFVAWITSNCLLLNLCSVDRDWLVKLFGYWLMIWWFTLWNCIRSMVPCPASLFCPLKLSNCLFALDIWQMFVSLCGHDVWNMGKICQTSCLVVALCRCQRVVSCCPKFCYCWKLSGYWRISSLMY